MDHPEYHCRQMVHLLLNRFWEALIGGIVGAAGDAVRSELEGGLGVAVPDPAAQSFQERLPFFCPLDCSWSLMAPARGDWSVKVLRQ